MKELTIVRKMKDIARAIMSSKTEIVNVFGLFKSIIYIYRIKQSKKFAQKRYFGEIIRETHSIEKGLSLENVRLGFGLAKFMESDEVIRRYKQSGGNMRAEPFLMYIDAVKSYLDFHKERGFKNSVVERVEHNYKSLSREIGLTDGTWGGIKRIQRRQFDETERNILASLFEGRHSVREFNHTPVNIEDLKSAIHLAMHCPTACNRQCQRLYIVDKKDFSLLNKSFDGVGGFADDLDKILFITGSMSVYRYYETFQWIVTGSIFAAYLSLALEIYGIGSCFIQRPVLPDKNWRKVSANIGVPDDEQLICCIGIGNLKESFNAPISHRLSFDTMVKFVKS